MTTKQYILEVFSDYPHLEWIAGGTIEDRVRQVAKTKASGVARALRGMSEIDKETKLPLKSNSLAKRHIRGYVEYKKVIV